MFVELKPQLTGVAHRIDDLEMIAFRIALRFQVAHRIDDLENLTEDMTITFFVAHRPDDLENIFYI